MLALIRSFLPSPSFLPQSIVFSSFGIICLHATRPVTVSRKNKLIKRCRSRRVLSHVTGYPARSRDRSCDRHTAIATQSPPHGPSHPRPGHVPGHVMSHVPGYVSAPLTMGTHQGPLTLGHSRRPLALWHLRPLLLFGLRPLFPRGQHPSSTMADGGLCLSAALGPRRPLTYGGLWPMGHPWPQ